MSGVLKGNIKGKCEVDFIGKWAREKGCHKGEKGGDLSMKGL